VSVAPRFYMYQIHEGFLIYKYHDFFNLQTIGYNCIVKYLEFEKGDEDEHG